MGERKLTEFQRDQMVLAAINAVLVLQHEGRTARAADIQAKIPEIPGVDMYRATDRALQRCRRLGRLAFDHVKGWRTT